MNQAQELRRIKASQLPSEHFFAVSADTPTKSVLERMRDEACPVAVLTDNHEVVGSISAAVAAEIVGQPARWTEAASQVMTKVPVVAPDATAVEVQKALRDNPMVVVQGPVAVISRGTWLRFLNNNFNTMIFNRGPEQQRSTRAGAAV